MAEPPADDSRASLHPRETGVSDAALSTKPQRPSEGQSSPETGCDVDSPHSWL